MYSDFHQVQWEPVSATKTCFVAFSTSNVNLLFLKTFGLNYMPLKVAHGHGRECNGKRGSQGFEKFKVSRILP